MRLSLTARVLVLGHGLAACGSQPRALEDSSPAGSALAPLSLAADARMVAIPAGPTIAGSTPEERDAAYRDYARAAGHDAAREHHWFDRESDRHVLQMPAFQIDLMPVTQAQYAESVATGAVAAPTMDADTWRRQGFAQDFATQVARFAWHDGRPPAGREDHPVVLVTYDEAARYCEWRGHVRGEPRRLPTAAEFERAARGPDGFVYPWGAAFDPSKLDSVAQGPGDTVAAGSYPEGASPFGVLDLAGNVFQWTATPWAADPGADRDPSNARSTGEMTVKGSAWEDYAGLGRGASAHGRGRGTRHVIVGFRCAGDASRPD